MLIALVLILLAIVLGLGGLFLEGLKWLLILAVILFVVGAVVGAIEHRRTRL
jgi:cell division protein FtsW (lipid II flippase)